MRIKSIRIRNLKLMSALFALPAAGNVRNPAAENTFFESATAYIEGLIELDASRYVLLSRTGRLLSTLRIDVDRVGRIN